MTCPFCSFDKYLYETKVCYVCLEDRDYIDTTRIRNAMKLDDFDGNCDLCRKWRKFLTVMHLCDGCNSFFSNGEKMFF